DADCAALGEGAFCGDRACTLRCRAVADCAPLGDHLSCQGDQCVSTMPGSGSPNDGEEVRSEGVDGGGPLSAAADDDEGNEATASPSSDDDVGAPSGEGPDPAAPPEANSPRDAGLEPEPVGDPSGSTPPAP